jgi:hypothetical protein
MEELERKWIFLNDGLNYKKGALVDFLGPYFERVKVEFNDINNNYRVEDSKDIHFFFDKEEKTFTDDINALINKYNIIISEISLDEGEKKDERELLMDKKSSRAYEEIFDVIKRYFTDDRTHLSLKGNTIHFEKRNPEIGEWIPEAQELLAKKQWKEDGLIQNWANPKSVDPFRLDILNMTTGQLGVKGDILILLNNYLEEDMGCTGDIAVGGMPFRKDSMLKRGSKELESANQLERSGKILKESEGGAFAYYYKVGDAWWQKWLKDNAARYDITYDKQDRLYLIYEGNAHILTYNTKTGEIFTDKELNELTTAAAVLVEKIEKLAGKKITLL